MPLTTEDNEWLFDAMAQAVDQADAEQTPLLLAKFAMLLANAVGDRGAVELALTTAQAHLRKR
jgi:Protein of unknown function (DUF2783)